jgi:hypothetical protein
MGAALMPRKYSTSEIHSMRVALNLIVPWRDSRQVRIIEIEEQLRTYMLNGTSPEELEREANRIAATRID